MVVCIESGEQPWAGYIPEYKRSGYVYLFLVHYSVSAALRSMYTIGVHANDQLELCTIRCIPLECMQRSAGAVYDTMYTIGVHATISWSCVRYDAFDNF